MRIGTFISRETKRNLEASCNGKEDPYGTQLAYWVLSGYEDILLADALRALRDQSTTLPAPAISHGILHLKHSLNLLNTERCWMSVIKSIHCDHTDWKAPQTEQQRFRCHITRSLSVCFTEGYIQRSTPTTQVPRQKQRLLGLRVSSGIWKRRVDHRMMPNGSRNS